MFSIAFVFRRREGMSLEEFHEHYRDVHSKVATRMPGLIGYTQHPVRRDAPAIGDHLPESDIPFDAISVYTYESDEAAAAAFTSEINAELEADSVKMIDFSNMITLPVAVRKVL
ncbi:EthD domain-containing protein [Novosphingobium sp. 1949]|uniref:EthD domain-containing protein n=1 Tax=Novosphingobium organovorum TaxID=2930092 RepID=A0ABT0BCB0_9SPHN|nr:EthD domain-containing protein [Novosphingobium organovorum]MCJ2182508.1 EthD domain-containing protein [Novosphingobium organovorum]